MNLDRYGHTIQFFSSVPGSGSILAEEGTPYGATYKVHGNH